MPAQGRHAEAARIHANLPGLCWCRPSLVHWTVATAVTTTHRHHDLFCACTCTQSHGNAASLRFQIDPQGPCQHRRGAAAAVTFSLGTVYTLGDMCVGEVGMARPSHPLF